MASEEAIVAAFKVLARAFAGDVDRERVELYRAALEDLSDAQIKAACIVLVRTYTGEFIPPPARIRAAVGADAVTPADVDAVIRRIQALATYVPSTGMVPPRIVTVRERIGEAAAQAYAAAGAERMFRDDDPVGANIARREFATAFQEWSRRESAGLLGEPRLRQIDRRAQALIGDVVTHVTPSEDVSR